MSFHEHDVDVIAGWDEAQDIFDLTVELVVDEEEIESWVRERQLPDSIMPLNSIRRPLVGKTTPTILAD